MIITPDDYATKPSVRRFADEVLARVGITDVPAASVWKLEISETEIVMWQHVKHSPLVRWCDHNCYGLTSHGVPLLCHHSSDVVSKRTRFDLRRR